MKATNNLDLQNNNPQINPNEQFRSDLETLKNHNLPNLKKVLMLSDMKDNMQGWAGMVAFTFLATAGSLLLPAGTAATVLFAVGIVATALCTTALLGSSAAYCYIATSDAATRFPS